MSEAASTRKVGFGLDDGCRWGPCHHTGEQGPHRESHRHGADEGAKLWSMAADRAAQGYEDGYWVFPTILDEVDPAGVVGPHGDFWASAEPHARSRISDDAIRLVNARSYGNMACIFTSSGGRGPPISLRGRRRQHRRKHRRGCAHGVSSHSADGTRVSLETCTGRAGTALSSTRRRRSSSSDGHRSGVGGSDFLLGWQSRRSMYRLLSLPGAPARPS